MRLSDIVVAEAIVPRLAAQTRDGAIAELVQALADAGAMPNSSAHKAVQSVLAREAQVTTGVGKGMAVPHAKVEGVERPVAAIGCSCAGIDFSALDGRPVYSVILLLSNPDNPDEHIHAMEATFKHIQRDAFRQALRQSRAPDEIADVVREADESNGA